MNTTDEQLPEDLAKEIEFLSKLPEMQLELIKNEAQMGPDGWPYLFVKSVDQGEPFQALCHWLSARGIGLVVNPQKEYPDSILTYGMLWNYKERGVFFNDLKDQKPIGDIQLTVNDQLFYGSPTESFLPSYVRKVLKQFFLDQGVLNPRVLLLTTDKENYDLAFSVESLDNPPKQEWNGIAEAISWFLPADYSILLLEEKSIAPFQVL